MTTTTSCDFTELPDINVLIALYDHSHPFHEKAKTWFEGLTTRKWATCPITENGFIRIISGTAFPGNTTTPAGASAILAALIARSEPSHTFWPDSVSFRDTTIFRHAARLGPKQITDVTCLAFVNIWVGRS